jgi:hypothetical protein
MDPASACSKDVMSATRRGRAAPWSWTSDASTKALEDVPLVWNPWQGQRASLVAADVRETKGHVASDRVLFLLSVRSGHKEYCSSIPSRSRRDTLMMSGWMVMLFGMWEFPRRKKARDFGFVEGNTPPKRHVRYRQSVSYQR